MSCAMRFCGMSWIWRGLKSLIQSPLPSNATLQGGFWNMIFHTHDSNTVGNPINCHKPTSASISVLLNPRSPPAIFRRVIPVVFNSVERHSCWTFTHVFKKQVESAPSGTYLNTPSTVPLESRMVPVIASLSHTVPNGVSFKHGGRHTRQSVGFIKNRGPFPSKAPTGQCRTLSEAKVENNHLVSAIAKAEALRVTAAGIARREDYKSCKSSVGWDKFPGTHINVSFIGVFSNGRTASTVRPLRFYTCHNGGQQF